VIVRIAKVHLSDQAREIPVVRKMMRHRSISPVQEIRIVDRPGLMRV
tara:strand:- start:223 stop:363 length:141 start_codon:yes stop_codon:yes gene_type:complete